MIEIIRKIVFLLDRKDKVLFFALILFALLGACLETLGVGLVPIFISALNDPTSLSRIPFLKEFSVVSANTQTPELIPVVCLSVAALFVIKNIFLFSNAYFQNKFIYGQHGRTALNLFRAYSQIPYGAFIDRDMAQMTTVLRVNVYAVFVYIMTPLFLLISESMTVVLIVSLIAFIEPRATIVSFVFLGGLSFAFFKLTKAKVLKIGIEQQARTVQIQKYVGILLDGFKEIKALGRESSLEDSFQNEIRYLENANISYHTIHQIPRFFIETIAIVGMMMLVVILLKQGRAMSTILPLLSLFAISSVRLMPSATRMLSSINTIRYHTPSLNAVHAELSDVPLRHFRDSAPPVISPRVAIGLENVTFKFVANKTVLDQVNLSIPVGSSVAFVGTSGAGKSTLVDLLLGLFVPTEGRILADDIDINTNIQSWRENIGYIPQSIYISDDTIRGNIAFGVPPDEISDEQIMEAAKLAQVWSFICELPNGLSTRIGEKGVRISGGQRQRIGIARALYKRPSILILDEATAALDSKTEADLTEAIEKFSENRTLIVVAHRLSTVKHCDRIYLLMDGKLQLKTYAEISHEDIWSKET